MLVINKIAWSELILMSHTTYSNNTFVDKSGMNQILCAEYLHYRVSKKVGCSLFIQLVVTVTNLKSIKT